MCESHKEQRLSLVLSASPCKYLIVDGKKRGADSVMVLEIDGKSMDLSIYLGPDPVKQIRYELTSEHEIEPLDAAFSLWLIVKSICIDAGITPDLLIKQYDQEADETKH